MTTPTATTTTTTRLGMVPGPTTLRASVVDAYSHVPRNACSDLQREFVQLYAKTADTVLSLLHAKDGEVVVMMGEAMLGLWGSLSSVLCDGDLVVSVGNGLYGHGIGEMAQSKGATVRFVGEVWERSLNETELQQLEHEIEHHKPRLVTVVHCDTPSALLMPREQLERIGAACTKAGSLLMADVVSSFGTTEIDVSRSHIDLAVIGTQKALSCLPDLTVVYVSPRAWERIEQRKYAGYDALLPWRNFRTSEPAFPYTMSWHSVHALHSALEALVHEGPAAVYERHAQVAARTRQALRAMGVRLFIADDSDASPSVTAAFVPDGWEWQHFNEALQARGLLVGGSYGKLAGRAFRIGHMGSQAYEHMVDEALAIVEAVMREGPPSSVEQ